MLCLIVGGPYLCLGWQHYVMTGVVNVAAQSVLLFLCLNFIVCLWELCLCYRYSLIHSTHQKRVKDGQTKRIPVVVFRSMELGEIFSSSFWSNIWIDYARFDPAYSDSKSAGYNIDVGNGHSTLLPTLFLMWSMVNPLAGPKTTGIVGIMAYWQMLYGTVVYFFSFFNTGMHKNLSMTEVVAAILLPSMIWIICPFVGIVGSVRLIMEEDFSVWQ